MSTPNSDRPLVTVIVPGFNVENYVRKAVESVLNQTYSNLELILVDDASTDGTLGVMKSFTDPRIRVLVMERNSQKIGAVNEALKQAKGDLIAFQDADDWSEPNRVEEQVKAFRADSSLGICFTGYVFEGKETKTPGRIALTNEELRDEFLHFGYKSNSDFNSTTCATMMITRPVLLRTNGYNEFFKGRAGEDIQWIYRILKNFRGITVPQALYHYVQRDDSYTGIQVQGKNAKAAYSWQLLRHIIYKDVVESIDLLAPGNQELLKAVELQACEEQLLKTVADCIRLRNTYENSTSLKIGRMFTSIFKFSRKRTGR